MSILNPDFWMSLVSIVVIDLVLAGDNAIVIGMAARNLPEHLRKRTILWGTIAAIIVRALLTLAVVWLLHIPLLRAIGSLILIWIAFNLLVSHKEDHDVASATSLLGAIQTIVVADVVMGLDNVLAIAGASHGSFLLVVTGLLISVPIMVWGSTIILHFMERFPVIVYVGSAILAWTAARMFTEEPLFADVFHPHPVLRWSFIVAVVVGVVALGVWRNKRKTGHAV